MKKFNHYSDSATYWENLVGFVDDRVKENPNDKFRISLSGGSSANVLDHLFESESLAGIREKVEFYQVDDRYVSPDDKDSNQLLINSKIAADDRLICFDTSLEIKKCVQKYENDLLLDEDGYLFDLTILGVGPDGHVASLFPQASRPDGVDQIIDLSEDGLTASAQTSRFAGLDRLTLTYEAIEKSRNIMILLWGEGKLPILRMMEERGDLPVHQILEMDQSSVWFWK